MAGERVPNLVAHMVKLPWPGWHFRRLPFAPGRPLFGHPGLSRCLRWRCSFSNNIRLGRRGNAEGADDAALAIAGAALVTWKVLRPACRVVRKGFDDALGDALRRLGGEQFFRLFLGKIAKSSRAGSPPRGFADEVAGGLVEHCDSAVRSLAKMASGRTIGHRLISFRVLTDR